MRAGIPQSPASLRWYPHLHGRSKLGGLDHFSHFVGWQLGLQGCNHLRSQVGALHLGQCLAALLGQLQQQGREGRESVAGGALALVTLHASSEPRNRTISNT